jgi:hypothetical protein
VLSKWALGPIVACCHRWHPGRVTGKILGDSVEVVGLDREIPVGELVRFSHGAGASQPNSSDVRMIHEQARNGRYGVHQKGTLAIESRERAPFRTGRKESRNELGTARGADRSRVTGSPGVPLRRRGSAPTGIVAHQHDADLGATKSPCSSLTSHGDGWRGRVLRLTAAKSFWGEPLRGGGRHRHQPSKTAQTQAVISSRPARTLPYLSREAWSGFELGFALRAGVLSPRSWLLCHGQ